MENSTNSPDSEQVPLEVGDPTNSAQVRLYVLSDLLQDLDEVHPQAIADRAEREQAFQDHLVSMRLGVASSLFTALRAKHAPTASHCLRVALGTSSWGMFQDLGTTTLDELEIAALLHDVGKIGIPDCVLLKPGKLSRDEQATVERHREIGVQILLSCCSSQDILDIVKYAPGWYDGSKKGFDRRGNELPLGARMVSIIDAFDSMTTDHVYRRAMSRERALSELFHYSGAQFDPQLVEQFANLMSRDQVKMTSDVARRWLQSLTSERANQTWRLVQAASDDEPLTVENLFHQRLLDSMHDGVIFVDSHHQVLLWNRAAERMTGIPADAILQKQWSPTLIDMRDEDGALISHEECPIAYTLQAGVQMLRRLTVLGRGGRPVSVDAHMVPVIGRDGVTYGATLLLHDASSQITLEERVQSLHEKATRDPLTQVANRAEFDRMHEQFIRSHEERELPCSLIICDLDHFKKVNDTYGHQAGDEALVSFATLLRRSCRPGDVVARYGGEEFVILCVDCDNATATSRAEAMRRDLAAIAQPSLSGKNVTASFGVTELQPGDTTETMLRRADRALLQAKDNGRNTVVQLGGGALGKASRPGASRSSWFSWFQKQEPDQLLQQLLLAAVPLNLAAEKLKGFVADHHAEIIKIEDNRILLLISGANLTTTRRDSDRVVDFYAALTFYESQLDHVGRHDPQAKRTVVDVAIRSRRPRDRRRKHTAERARQLLLSLKSYLMAQDLDDPDLPDDPTLKDSDRFRRAKDVFAQWM